MLVKYALLGIIGLASGFAIAGGTFAFIVMIGVLPRLAARTRTAWAYWQYENMVILGGLIGNILYLFSVRIYVGYFGLIVIGLSVGIYVGCFAMALAEVLNIIPILAKRIRLRVGLAIIVSAMAIGKALGTFYQMALPALK